MTNRMGRVPGANTSGLGARIVARRKALGYAEQADLLEAMKKRRKRGTGKLSQTALSLYEGDHRVPSAARLVQLADALECSVDWLLGRVAWPEMATEAPAGALRQADGPEVIAAPSEPQVPPARRERAVEREATLEEACALAEAQGKTSARWGGKLYVKRRHGWEPLP